MKKILLVFLSFMCLLPLFTVTAYAEEVAIETTEFIKVEYSYDVNGEKGIITLISETECELSDESGVFLRTTYTIEDDLLIINKDKEQVHFKINDNFELEFIGFFEIPNTEEIFEEKTYVFENEGGKATLTLTSENECSITLVMGEESDTQTFYYEMFNGVLKLYEADILKVYMVLNDVNMTFGLYEGPLGEITITEAKGGEVLTEVTAGLVGEVVQIIPNPGILYELESIYVNGVKLEPLEDGTYEFVLVEGENNITYSYYVSDEKVKDLAELLEQVKNKDWKSIFTVNNLLTVISWIITTFCSSGFFITLVKMKKYKTKTILEVMEDVNNVIKVDVSKTIEEILIDVLDPILEKIATNINNITEDIKVLKKCTILSQENTPESRLAILNELDKNTNDSQELINMAKNLIQEEVSKIEKSIEERDNSIEELKSFNNNESDLPHL